MVTENKEINIRDECHRDSGLFVINIAEEVSGYEIID